MSQGQKPGKLLMLLILFLEFGRRWKVSCKFKQGCVLKGMLEFSFYTFPVKQAGVGNTLQIKKRDGAKLGSWK